MRKLFVFVIIALFSLAVFAFAQSPTVYAEGEITTISEEITTEITTVDEPLSEEDINAIIEAAGISEAVAQAWEGLPQSVKTVLGIFGIATPSALGLGVVALLYNFKKNRGVSAQTNARLRALLGIVGSFGDIVKLIVSSMGDNATAVKQLLPLLTFTAKASQLVLAASSNDDIRALKVQLSDEYSQATGQIPADFGTLSDSQKLSAAAADLLKSIDALKTA